MSKLHDDLFDRLHFNRVEQYVKEIAKIYYALIQKVSRLSSLNKVDKAKPFHLKDYPALQKQIDQLFEKFAKNIEVTIQNNSSKEWLLAERKQKQLVDEIAKRTNLNKTLINKYNRPNMEALLAFQNRKTDGLRLSDRIWNYTNQFKNEIELGLDIGLGEGKSASELSRDLRSYLKEPDRLYRKVRDKHGQLVLSQRAKEYHPGQGVYRSSYKNAMRLTRTENNMAYHEANYLKYQEFDFVIGIEIRLSNNPNHCPFCASMAGKYPKHFKFWGWHPQCRCTTIPILKSFAEIQADNERILEGKEPLRSTNEITKLHEPLQKWVKDNRHKIDTVRVQPYWMQQNRGYLFGEYNLLRDKIGKHNQLAVKKVSTNIIFSDVTGGLATMGLKGISQAVNYYNKLEVNAEKVSILKAITQMKEFEVVRHLSNADNKIYGFNIKQFDELLKAHEMPKNITIAKKLLQNGYDVYLLPNVSGAKSADFIGVKGNKYYYLEGKTINGKSTIKQRLIEASTQSDRAILDIVGTKDTNEIYGNIKWFFENNDNVKEIIMFKGSRLISLTRRHLGSKISKKNFIKQWEQKK
ncbi:hypothetical protein [Riemerella anatipestifer]|uniref:hypothetical protein n=1 Tax=Riemerella anatipestifer TaxID=34085 RepID=UPI002363F42E|nr:hypothetical protein [Riemerella anatipestifer]MDD1539412.1 hypothetical protein [Riemerella anatipestifer]